MSRVLWLCAAALLATLLATCAGAADSRTARRDGFWLGGRYGRSHHTHSHTNDRFFLGARYGKRAWPCRCPHHAPPRTRSYHVAV